MPFTVFMSPNDDIVLDLNFVPAWARRPPDQTPYADFKSRSGSKRERSMGSRSGGTWNRGEPSGRDSMPGRRRRTGVERSERRDSRSRIRADHEGGRGQQDDRDQRLWTRLEVSFIPERRGLKPLARLFARTARAYSLMDVASMFLRRPEFFAVKLEALKTGDGKAWLTLYQCKECQAVFLDKEQALIHGFARHFSLFYDQEETRVEPPKGKFVCVARCGLSGVLLGPPNYHEFNDRVLEMHRTRFASMSLEDYRKRIVNDTDPAALDQWKQDVCRHVTYRTRQESVPQCFQRRSEAEAHFRQRVAPGLIRAGARFIIPGLVSRQMEDTAVNRAIQRAWEKENRFPLKLSIALHPAFRSFGLYIFKTPAKAAFVTAIHPHPIDPSQALAVIQRILEYLVQHPGSSRRELVASLLPGVASESAPVAAMISQLRWLIDKGHVIEFSNGKLAVLYRRTPTSTRQGNAATSGDKASLAPTPS